MSAATALTPRPQGEAGATLTTNVTRLIPLNQIAAGIVRALHTPKTNRSRTHAHRATY